jgi:rSAM/selenodomain-associated transferase 2
LRALLRARRGELLGLNLSVVIPALNAARTLPACLDRVAGAGEIILVDGGSTDGTQAIAKTSGARLLDAPKGRGVQLRTGGEAARGDWLLFLHADTLLEQGWREAVQRHVETASRYAACFRFRLDAAAWQARVIEKGVAARVRMLGLPYGDQGLLVPRRLYEAVGGYRPLPLMEDVDLVRRIGRDRLRVLDVGAVTAADRWESDGWFRRSARNLTCLTLYLSGASPDRVARLYSSSRG